MSDYVYRCPYAPGDEAIWNRSPIIWLTGAYDGELPRLSTNVRFCRTDSHVHVRFECVDDHVVATYTDRDDPIYKEDVVEIFIDETGNGRFYKEIELSPRNVVFDARINKEEGGKQKVDSSWNMEGLQTQVTWIEKEITVYHLSLPIAAFDSPPASGSKWRINLFRIDNDAEGGRHYWSWSPTGVQRDFHVPSRFGTLLFD